MMIAILMLAVIAVIIVYRASTPSAGPGEEPPPEVFVDEGMNFPVHNAPGANNEPSVAVNPTNPDNIVAGGNDYETPNDDSWCGYYWSEDGGKSWTTGLLPGYPRGPVSVLVAQAFCEAS